MNVKKGMASKQLVREHAAEYAAGNRLQEIQVEKAEMNGEEPE